MDEITFEPAPLPEDPNQQGRWKTAVLSFIDSGLDSALVDIGETPAHSAQTMSIVAARSLGMADVIGVSRREGRLFYYRRDHA
jgi:hypothetical protein